MRIVIMVVELASDMYKAQCPALPGCTVLGRSRGEAAERISCAISGYLASFDAAVPGQIELDVVEPPPGAYVAAATGAAPKARSDASPGKL